MVARSSPLQPLQSGRLDLPGLASAGRAGRGEWDHEEQQRPRALDGSNERGVHQRAGLRSSSGFGRDCEREASLGVEELMLAT